MTNSRLPNEAWEDWQERITNEPTEQELIELMKKLERSK